MHSWKGPKAQPVEQEVFLQHSAQSAVPAWALYPARAQAIGWVREPQARGAVRGICWRELGESTQRNVEIAKRETSRFIPFFRPRISLAFRRETLLLPGQTKREAGP